MDPPRRRRRVGKVTFQPKKDTGVVAGRLMPAAHGKGGWLQCAAGERGALEVSAARAAHWWRGRRRRAVSAVGCSECDFSGFLAAAANESGYRRPAGTRYRTSGAAAAAIGRSSLGAWVPPSSKSRHRNRLVYTGFTTEMDWAPSPLPS
jgi:hypothetical protein